MKKGLRRFLLALAVLIIASATTRIVNAAEEEKPLGQGWLSLDCCIGPLDNAIANGKDSLQKATGLNFGGFLDTSYTWSSNHPRSPYAISLRYFDKDQNKIVFNNFHIFVEKPEKDWGVGFRVSGDFGRTGELLREATLWGKSLNKEPSAEVREAYLTTTIPLGEGIGVKGGLFVTTLGTEILPNPGAYNDNISRSYLFNFGVPLRHLGMMFNYPVHKMVNVNFGVVTGWDNPRDNNHQPSFMGGVTVTPSDMVSFASNLIYGAEQRSGAPKRFTISNVLTVKPIDPLALYLEYTFGSEGDASLGGDRDGKWQGLSGIASYNWTDRFNTALRAEVFYDRDGARLLGEPFGSHARATVSEMTLTGSYKFTKMLLGRTEVRQDWSDRNMFRRGASSADSNQTTLAMQLIYTF